MALERRICILIHGLYVYVIFEIEVLQYYQLILLEKCNSYKFVKSLRVLCDPLEFAAVFYTITVEIQPLLVNQRINSISAGPFAI